jgi:glycerol-3-phosphate dehydrogenase (NAD(P)+)
MKQITFVGAGAIGTSLGNILAEKGTYDVALHSIESDIVADISANHFNSRYFPNIRLNRSLRATGDDQELGNADVIFLAIPSPVLVEYVVKISSHIHPETILVNLAKGFGCEHRTIYDCLRGRIRNPLATLKGPSFAREIINFMPTSFTLGYEKEEHRQVLTDLFRGTVIALDYSRDIPGVEILSILKNMYAVAIGIVDAQFSSPNLRFMVLTKAFREMRRILLHYGGSEDTLFRYCGYGDFTLTALNDLSRNRTLGLLIGKGFFTEHISHELVLEGRTAVNIFYEELSKQLDVDKEYPIISGLFRIFNASLNVTSFLNHILEVEEP